MIWPPCRGKISRTSLWINKYMLETLNQIIPDLAKKMEGIIGNKLRIKTTDDSFITSWSRIPNCADFQISTGNKDLKLLPLGISVNERTEVKIFIMPEKNKPLNKYISYQLKRLEKLREKDPRAFWHVAWLHMKTSRAFRASAFQHVLTGWERKYPKNIILRIWKKVHTMANKMDDETDYRRVYIPKPGSDSKRPLGVPTIPWRIYNHMFTNFMSQYLRKSFLPSQHGFIPGKGTLTAWREIFDKVINSDFIYECDLKQFFPSVNVAKISDILIELGVPKRTVYWIENVNRVNPKLPDNLELDESKVIMSEQDKYDISHGIFRPESKIYDVFREINNDQLLFEITGLDNWFEILQQQWAILDSFGGATIPGQFEGVPQGLPSSPLLSILTLKKFLQQAPSVSYADDPIFYGNKDFQIKDMEELKLNLSKSSWVKRDGKWLKPLKYLGLTYHPQDGSLHASTRKGSTLSLGKPFEKRILESESSRLEHIFNEANPYRKSSRAIWENKIFGLIQSRLYSGSWNINLPEQDFSWKPIHGSWGSWRDRRNINIFNSSSKAIRWLVRDRERKFRKVRS